MKNQITLSEKKVLEHDEKSFQDTLQLFNNLSKDNIQKEIERCKEDPRYEEMLPTMCFDKGRTLWLELKVEDSYLSGLLLTWMYSHSKFDNKPGLQVMGCTLKTIMFEKPSGYPDDVKQAIRKLYEEAFGH